LISLNSGIIKNVSFKGGESIITCDDFDALLLSQAIKQGFAKAVSQESYVDNDMSLKDQLLTQALTINAFNKGFYTLDALNMRVNEDVFDDLKDDFSAEQIALFRNTLQNIIDYVTLFRDDYNEFEEEVLLQAKIQGFAKALCQEQYVVKLVQFKDQLIIQNIAKNVRGKLLLMVDSEQDEIILRKVIKEEVAELFKHRPIELLDDHVNLIIKTFNNMTEYVFKYADSYDEKEYDNIPI